METAVALPDVLTRATMIARSRPTRVTGPQMAELVGTVVDRYAELCRSAAAPDHLNDWLAAEVRRETTRLRTETPPGPAVDSRRDHVVPRPRRSERDHAPAWDDSAR